ncbi:MAG TPA: amino acid permease C-terminal domain-containing protein, partial [Bacteroidia bacterium]|nr:amino acid permease C-terminal domain-containing protein [Bacteroidia bacterium]
VKSPEIPRPFRAPAAPFVSVMGVLVCTAMIVALDHRTLKAAFAWMLIGIVVYMLYGRHHSKLKKS